MSDDRVPDLLKELRAALVEEGYMRPNSQDEVVVIVQPSCTLLLPVCDAADNRIKTVVKEVTPYRDVVVGPVRLSGRTRIEQINLSVDAEISTPPAGRGGELYVIVSADYPIKEEGK